VLVGEMVERVREELRALQAELQARAVKVDFKDRKEE